MRRALLLVTLLLPLAATTQGFAPADEAPGFRVTAIPGFGGEPNLALGADGSVFVAYPGAAGSVVWKRPAGDDAFGRLAMPNVGFGGFDEALAVAPDGTVYVAGMYPATPPVAGAPGFTFCSSVTRSRDGGDTWDAPVEGACIAGRVDRPWIEVDDLGHVWLVQHANCCTGQHDVHWSADGVTFLPTGIANPVGDFPGNLFADRARGMVYSATTCRNIGVCLTGSPTDVPLPVWELRGFIRTASPTAGLNHVAGAVDEAGNLYLTWAELRGSSQVFVASSRDGGITWSAPQRVSGANAATFPWIAAGADGRLGVVWYEADRRGADPSTMPADTVWNVHGALRAGWDAEWAHALVSETPHHVGALCTHGAVCWDEGLDRTLLDFFEADIDAAGRLHVAWPDSQQWVVRHAEQTAGPLLR